MASVAVLDTTGKKTATVELPEEIFARRVNTHVLYQAVEKYRASKRQGTAKTKERWEVSGGGVKPHRQKGTGRARAGSNRSPLWVGGGNIFGPQPRSFVYSIPKKVKKQALQESLNSKLKDKTLFCIADLKDSFEKTKEFAKVLKSLKIEGRTLAVLDGSDPSIDRVTRNLPRFTLMRSQDVNAFDILRYKNLLVSQTALKKLLERAK